ncbi:hypothetical protein CAPTEDRAFT_228172 [Capitella teleta]|uniref:Major facilitator superfamily (MFS) profile domain-containing protein n=1 Tax=Capitella teleta TaxID=283909 RepID=R7UB30_CAPTE|nr:hypothetical protein CAPTEDRAFT_228172 [Capitella teleta]|eukprot:ELU03336.1 hypothetical protein CAPTEDRAFT_228172 [Capitella teleta]
MAVHVRRLGTDAHGCAHEKVELLAESDDQGEGEAEVLRHHFPAPSGQPELHQRRSCLGPFTIVCVASGLAAVGGVLFGYDTGIVSGALLQLKDEFNLSCFQQELVVTMLLIGALCASFVAGFIIDRFGRRRTIIFNSLIFIGGGMGIALSQSLLALLVGRFVLGFAVSISAIAECVYISEISPANKRGFCVSLNEFGITVGLLLAYLVNFAFITVPDGWRFMFGLSAIPAAIQGFSLLFMPSSPRFLMSRGREAEAKVVLLDLRGPTGVEAEIVAIKQSLENEKSHSIKDLCSGKDKMRSRFFIASVLVILQQVTGQPTVLYYAPTIFKLVGFVADTAATLATVGLGVVKVLSTLVALFCIDHAGRRTFFLCGTIVMAISICTMGFITLSWPSVDATDDCGSTQLNITSNERDFTAVEMSPTMQAQRWAVLIALMLYVIGYALSFGPGTWLILSEIFPSPLRGRATSAATVFNWGANLVMSATLLSLINVIGVPGAFLSYGSMCVLSVLFIYFFLPETKGRTLEEISEYLKRRPVIQGSCRSSCCHSKPVVRRYQMVLNEAIM